MKKNNKGLAIFGMLALCAVLAAGVFLFAQRSGGGSLQGGIVSGNEAEPGGIISIPAIASPEAVPGGATAIPAIVPPDVGPVIAIPNEQDAGTGSQAVGDISLTAIEEKPEPPELPDTAHRDGEPGETTLDPAMTNPDAKPDIAPAPVEPSKPKAPAPQAGDTNSNGEIYIPGFGYVKNEGGGSRMEQSQLDPEHTDFDKIIGH